MFDLESFRADTAEWLDRNGPQSIRGINVTAIEGTWGGRRASFFHPDFEPWLEVMAERGWTAPTWPKEYGGGGLSREEDKILQQEMRALRLPGTFWSPV